jgi:hypothetical protein
MQWKTAREVSATGGSLLTGVLAAAGRRPANAAGRELPWNLSPDRDRTDSLKIG